LKANLESEIIIIDSLSILASLIEHTERNEQLLANFLLKVIDLEQKSIQICVRPEATRFHEFLVRLLAHSADQTIMLQNLSTGLADDITGKMKVLRPKDRDFFTKETLFKLNERNAELITKGLISTSGKNDYSNLT